MGTRAWGRVSGRRQHGVGVGNGDVDRDEASVLCCAVLRVELMSQPGPEKALGRIQACAVQP